MCRRAVKKLLTHSKTATYLVVHSLKQAYNTVVSTLNWQTSALSRHAVLASGSRIQCTQQLSSMDRMYRCPLTDISVVVRQRRGSAYSSFNLPNATSTVYDRRQLHEIQRASVHSVFDNLQGLWNAVINSSIFPSRLDCMQQAYSFLYHSSAPSQEQRLFGADCLEDKKEDQ